tara:strand:+ start:426 stop:848 length:423 start_codon:yes stop_codon:yes gene_type:complete
MDHEQEQTQSKLPHDHDHVDVHVNVAIIGASYAGLTLANILHLNSTPYTIFDSKSLPFTYITGGTKFNVPSYNFITEKLGLRLEDRPKKDTDNDNDDDDDDDHHHHHHRKAYHCLSVRTKQEEEKFWAREALGHSWTMSI